MRLRESRTIKGQTGLLPEEQGQIDLCRMFMIFVFTIADLAEAF